MSKISTIISRKIRKFSKDHFKKRDYFVCIYGSFATGDNNTKSDLDVVFIVKDFVPIDFKVVKKFTINIHKEFNLKIDEEIPYKNKLLVYYNELEDVIKLKTISQRRQELLHISNW